MKKFILLSISLGLLPFTMVAQDDDLYFKPKKVVRDRSGQVDTRSYSTNIIVVENIGAIINFSERMRKEMISFNCRKGGVFIPTRLIWTQPLLENTTTECSMKTISVTANA